MPPVTPAGALVGRDNETALLTELVKELSVGHGSSVLIEGEPGIGKSALVRNMVTGAQDAGCQVFWGAGDELGQALPLVPFLDGLRVREPDDNPRRATIVRLLRGEATADRGTDIPGALAEQLLALVTEQCAAQPTILVVDDLQWADAASVNLWGRLARSAERLPLLLIGMMRPVPQRADLLALRRVVGEADRLPLTELSADATADLVARLAGGRPDSNLLRLAGGAAGNPLYVTELVAALLRSSNLVVTDIGAVELACGSAPGSLSAAIADRLGFVTGPTRDVLKAAALLGMEFAVSDLAVVLNRSVADLIPAMDEARAAGVLVESRRSLGFRHPLIRAALYDEMPAPLRAAWHRDVGRALAEAGAPPDRVARQMLWAVGGSADVNGSGDVAGPGDVAPAPDSAEPMDQWMLDWLFRTADPLIGQAPGVAAQLLTRARACSLVGSDEAGWLSSRLADALYRIGDRADAEQVVIQALGQPVEPDLFVDLHWTLAQCRMLAGSSAQSLSTLEDALTAPGLSARHRARLLVLAGRTHKYLGELDKAGQVATSALEAATEASDNGAMAWALHVLAAVALVRGELADALPLYDQALTVTRADPGLVDLRLLLQINQAVILGYLDQYERAFAAAGEARQLANQLGTTFRLAQAHGALGQLLFETGRWDEALTELATVPEELKEPFGACGELGIAAVICFHRGDVGEARRHLEAAAPHAERVGDRLVTPYALARSLDLEHLGELPTALAELTGSFTEDPDELDEIEDVLTETVRLAVATGELGTAQTFTGYATTLAAGTDVPHRHANALYCRGLVDHEAPWLLAAAEGYEDAGRPLLRAKALEAAAGEFVEIGERSQARAAFTQAVEVYMSLGAAADAARLQAEFRGHGIRRGPRVKHRQARSGWESLTPTEIKIAAFVEDGLSNPEIAGRLLLSRRTVATHVSHILKKLDVHSRTDIARESALRTVASR
jgi:DNA-binding CsgD family transcriptional regulator/tetratricopeptide (TPR) repeat protein